jgi:hypothetical protein
MTPAYWPAFIPALSFEERENRSPLSDESTARGRAGVSAFNRGALGASGNDFRPTQDAGCLFPLPWREGESSAAISPIPSASSRRSPGAVFPLPAGEGQGEGEGGLQPSGTRRFARSGALFPFAPRPAVIRQRMRGPLLQSPPSCVVGGLLFEPPAGIPEAKHLDAARCQPRIGFRVPGLLFGRAVSNAVPLEIQLSFKAKEVQDVRPERILSAEFIFGDTPVAQPIPHEFFGPRVVLPHQACDARNARGCYGSSVVELIDRSQAHGCFERCFPLTPALSLGEKGIDRRVSRCPQCWSRGAGA